MPDLISIIVPVYNCEKYIYESLSSIREQTYNKIEVIIIDDGSIDNTLDIAKQFSKVDNRFKIIEKNNGGVSSARNLGLKYATGEYICFIDGDDFCEKTLVEKMYHEVKKYDAEIGICALAFEYPNKTIVPGGERLGKNFILNKQQAILELYKGDIYSGHMPNKLFRKSVCESILFDEDIFICEDLIFCLKTFLKANSFVYIGEPLYHYRIHNCSAYQQSNIDKVYTSHYAYEKMDKCINSLQSNDELIKLFNLAFIFNDLRIKEIFVKQKIKNDYRFQIINKSLRNLYKKVFLKINLLQKVQIFIVVYFYEIYAMWINIKKRIKKLIRKHN